MRSGVEAHSAGSDFLRPSLISCSVSQNLWFYLGFVQIQSWIRTTQCLRCVVIFAQRQKVHTWDNACPNCAWIGPKNFNVLLAVLPSKNVLMLHQTYERHCRSSRCKNLEKKNLVSKSTAIYLVLSTSEVFWGDKTQQTVSPQIFSKCDSWSISLSMVEGVCCVVFVWMGNQIQICNHFGCCHISWPQEPKSQK